MPYHVPQNLHITKRAAAHRARVTIDKLADMPADTRVTVTAIKSDGVTERTYTGTVQDMRGVKSAERIIIHTGERYVTVMAANVRSIVLER